MYIKPSGLEVNQEQSSNAFRRLFKADIGGTSDAGAIIGVGISLLAAIPPTSTLILKLPFFLQITVKTGLCLLVAYCAMKLGRSALTSYRKAFYLKSSCNKESSDPDTDAFSESGLLFGYCTDTGEPLYIKDDDLCRHIFLGGQTGVGKTVLMKSLMFQQIQRLGPNGEKGGLLFIDGKLDADNIQELYEFACYCGRKQDFLVINPGQPNLSNSYNPILYGDADEISSRIMNLTTGTTNAGTEYYRLASEQALNVLISALKEANLDYNFLSLALLTMNEPTLESLLNYVQQLSPESMARKNLVMFLDQYSKDQITDGNANNMHIDLKKLKEILGGIGMRMHRFGVGDFGRVLNTFNPEVVMYDALKEGKIVYMALPTMGKDVAAENLGKITIADLKTAISWLQLNKEFRPKIPFLAFMDENSSYAIEQQAIMWEQARSAKVAFITGVQTDAGFNKVSPEFNERIKANCETKIFFKLSSTDTQNMAAEMIGMTKRVVSSEAKSQTTSSSSQSLQMGPGKNSSDGSSNQDSEREQEEFFITPDEFKGLDNGECIILRGRKVWNIRVPYLQLDDAIKASIGKVQINHPKIFKKTDPGKDKPNQNFDPMSQIDKYIEQSRAKRISKKKTKAPAQDYSDADAELPSD